MKSFYISILVIGLTACNSNDKTPVNTNTVSTLPSTGQTTLPVKANDTAISTVPVSSVIQTSAPSNAQTSTNTSNAKLNPAHGQPGHRCDIAVGAPLDSPPGTTTTTPSTQPAQAVQTVVPPVQQPASQPVANVQVPDTLTVNPAHGQPGHDCTIAVGQPLKKKTN